jgi:hypothetical protein
MRAVQIAILLRITTLVLPLWGQPGNLTPLSLTAKPTKMIFCRGDGEVAFLRIRAELQFTNQTDGQRVSINRGDLHVDYIQVAKQAEDFLTKNYELNISETSILESSINLNRLNPKLFLTLGPRESNTVELSFDIPVSAQNGKIIRGTVQPGAHTVVIWVSGWLGSDELAKQVQKKLAEIGKLWTSAVRSRPIELTIEAPSVIEWCR